MIFKENTANYILNRTIICVLALFMMVSSMSCVDVELIDKPNTKITLKLPTISGDHPSSFTVLIDGQKLIIGPEGNLPEMYPGVYPIVVYNNTPTVSVVNGIAEVNRINGQLNSFPDLFFSTSSELQIENNSTNTAVIELAQQTRLLEMRISPPTGGIYDYVSSIEGTLSGVAGRWDIVNNVAVGPAMEVPVKFVKQDNGSWLAKIRLLGVFGDKQKLIGKISFTDNSNQSRLIASNLRANQSSYSLDLQSDLTSHFRNFNTDKSVTFRLDGVIELPIEGSFDVTINDWKQVNESGEAW